MQATETIEVTATRIPEAVSTVPASITIITGDDLRARGVQDLAGALSLVPGAEAPPGGDAGPASAVPSFLGLHEFDAFLLVVDGVPWGGAFNPAIPTLDLLDVDRIEVLKGAAPVTYGATAFVGIIQVIHYPAGRAENRLQIATGTHGQAQGSASVALPALGSYEHSLTIQGASQGFADPREAVSDGRLLYRSAAPLAGGRLRMDLDMTIERQVPPSPVPRQGATLNTLTKLDANFNPSDARIDENRYHAVLGYTHATPLGLWDTTASYAYSDITDVRGFLRHTLADDGTRNADSQRQARRLTDSYLDTHLSAELGQGVDMLYGADLLYGLGKQSSINGAYYAPIRGGAVLPATTSLHVDEINTLSDQRAFFGQYAQLDWKPSRRADLFAGLRLNETSERRNSAHSDGFDATNNLAERSTRHATRPSVMAGASTTLWRAGADETVLYADYRNTFKPAAVDFGPDYTPDVLAPETAQEYEAGIKGRLLHGRLDFDADIFRLDFKNLVVATTNAAGNPILQNAGGQRLQGAEINLGIHVLPALTLSLDASYHESRFTRYTATEGGANINVAGNQLPLSPHVLASAGILYQHTKGLDASLITSLVGRRYLDLANTAPIAAYRTVAASIGYRVGRYRVLLSGTNLTDARPPVTQSEFGDQSYYLLPGRTVFLSLELDV